MDILMRLQTFKMHNFLIVGIISFYIHIVQTDPVDVALNKQIEARLTCGSFGSENFYSHSDASTSPIDRTRLQCQNDTSYPASYMLDGNLNTWWQSASRQRTIRNDWTEGDPEAVITIDLQQIFDVESISIRMGSSKRPQRLVVLKSDDGMTYSPWVIKVTESVHCTTLHQTRYLKNPEALDSVVCDLYTTNMLDTDEVITFDFDDVSADIIAWRSARFLKVEFYKMDITLGPNADEFHHFTVASIEVMAECICSGLHVGCNVSPVSGQYECVCGGNTQGEFCEQCLPFYNQQPFRQGESCEQCNCFEHASECFFDEIVAENGRSLNAEGAYSGGGVCVDCKNNTTGNNCEKCTLQYYRPAGREQTAQDACISCNCSTAGSVSSDITGVLGDCVMNSDVELGPGTVMLPGDCFCKENVQGSKCDECKAGFFNLQTVDAAGCQACDCEPAGTIGGSTVCIADAEGQCPCKQEVINRRCDECSDQFYGLSAENINGCLPCDCNAGGSLDNTCNKTDGQCNCQPNVGGRQCTEPTSKNFFPDLHFIHTEAEEASPSVEVGYKDIPGFSALGYAKLQANQETSLTLRFPVGTPLSGEVSFVIRYAASEPVSLSFVVMPVAGPSSVTLPLPVCSDGWCHVQTPDTYNLEENRIYTLELTPNADLALDKVVALPVEFTSTSEVLGEQATAFESTCDVIQDDMKIGTENEALCLISVFTLTSHYLDGTMACDCDQHGSYTNETCARYGGQCACKPGVGDRQCDVCLPEYYDLTSDGCKECSCVAADKVCDKESGQCECPTNVVGEKCEQCFTNYWNWNETVGCEACNCDVIGSSDLQCNLTTGECLCKPGVGGDKCDACLDGFTGLNSVTGCRSCDCDADGSLSLVCDPANAQCPCKENTQGQYCSNCRSSTFYNHAKHATGCLNCICMGISNLCTSTNTPLSIITPPLVNQSSPAFYLSTATERLTNLFASVTTLNSTEALSVELGIQSATFWVPNGEISGNLLKLYENNLSFTVHWTSLDVSGQEETEPFVILVGRNSATYKIPFDRIPKDEITEVVIQLTEVGAVNSTGGEVTRGEMLLALSETINILVPATYYSRAHTSSLLGFSYGVAAVGGTAGSSPGVELCACGIGYQGSSCEECAFGYKRAEVETHDYLGVCVACECNNHADDCDADTGVCINCLHNTAGDQCELCAAGYYGDATNGFISDCDPCPCYEPRVVNSTCSVVNENQVCSFCADGYTGDLCDTCEEFYFGNPEIVMSGTCERCECHGNSETCDPVTGECQDCGFNTTGFNCERCRDEWFGNASAQTCQPCECDLNGTASTICNYTSGQCDCYAGVGERTCNQCQPNFYGYDNQTIFGCADCECNPEGSADLQCDELGVCTCDQVSGGDKCDFCAEGYFGLPYKACQLCSCDLTGTVNASQLCERVFGQCDCKSGVAGQQCDVCERLYKDFSETGCTQCEVCQYSLGNDTLLLKQTWHTYWNETMEVQAIQQQDTMLQTLSTEINSTSNLLGLSEDTLNVLTTTVAELEAREPDYIDTVNTFMDEVNRVKVTSEVQNVTTSKEAARMAGLLEMANEASENVKQLNATTYSYLEILNGFVTSSDELLQASLAANPNEVNVTFDGELENVNAELVLVLETEDRANAMAADVTEQGNTIDELINATGDAQERVNSLIPKLTEVEENIDTIREVLQAAWTLVNATIANREYTVHILNETQGSVTYLTGLLGENQALYAEGTMLFNASKHVIEGFSNGDPPPVNSSIDLNDIYSFNQGADYLYDVLIPPLNLSLYNLTYLDLPRIRVKVEELMTQAQAITQTFESVSPLAQQAADAISDYEAVITVLEVAKALAIEANVTMLQVLAELEDVSEADLQESAETLALSTESLQAAVAEYDGVGTALTLQLNSLESGLDAVIARWIIVSARIDGFITGADELDILAKSPTHSDSILTANAVVAEVLSYETPLEPLVGQVSGMEEDMSGIQEKLANASLTETQIEDQLRTFQQRLENDIQRYVDLTSQDYTESVTIRNRIDNTVGRVEDKIQQALDMLEAMEQPVSFDTDAYAELTNPLAEASPFYNDVTFTFKYDLDPVGVLFLAENNVTGEKIVIQMENEQVVYEFANADTTMRAVSPAVLCRGCWFRIIATRYGIDGQLTVTKMSSGGKSVTHVRGESTLHNTLTLTSPVYIAGLPEHYNMEIVNGNVGFGGCIYSATFNGYTIPVWQKILHHSSTATCCSPPPSLPESPTIPAASFDNFGSYLRLSLPNLAISSSSHLAMEIRTFSPNAVVFLADMNGFSGYYGVFVQEGRLSLATSGGGESLNLQTEQSYNDKLWHRVSVQLNSSYALLHVETLNGSDWMTSEVISGSHSVDLLALTAPQYTLGAQNPDTAVNSGPVTASFAGCIQSFQHGVGEDLTLTDVTLSDVELQSSGVNMDTCYADVVSGIGFSEPRGYVALNDIPNPLNYMEFDILTFQPHGILIFAELSADPPNTFLYVALYHGDILVLFNQGSGIQQALGTRGLDLANGQSHTVKLDFRFPNSPRVMVGGQRHYGTMTMSPGMNLRNSRLFAGGVPPSITIDAVDLPVVQGIVGGIRNIKVNTRLINYFEAMDGELHLDAYLSGLPAPAEHPPPLPYPTDPPPPSTVAPTCAPNKLFSMSESGVRFGDEPVSYLALSIAEIKSMFERSFVIRVKFRAVQPSGILLYIASGTSGADSYFSLFLDEGFLLLSMESNTTISKSGATKLIKSKKSHYSNGQWWDVVALRLNDFLALTVPTVEYTNNGKLTMSDAPSTLEQLSNTLFLGGVTEQHTGHPFNSNEDITVGTASFHGCIKSVTISSHEIEEKSIELSSPLAAEGVSQCFEEVHPGVFLNSSNAYIRVMSAESPLFDIEPGFNLTISFRSAKVNGTLVVAYLDQSRFFLIDMTEGQICILIGNTLSQSAPLIAKSHILDVGFGLCSGELHTLGVVLEEESLLFNFDYMGWERIGYPQNFAVPALTGTQLYTGGIKDPGWSFPLPTSLESFYGCIQNLNIKGREFNLVTSTDKKSVVAGCPA